MGDCRICERHTNGNTRTAATSPLAPQAESTLGKAARQCKRTKARSAPFNKKLHQDSCTVKAGLESQKGVLEHSQRLCAQGAGALYLPCVPITGLANANTNAAPMSPSLFKKPET